jgi:hypothetical protein
MVESKLVRDYNDLRVAIPCTAERTVRYSHEDVFWCLCESRIDCVKWSRK